MNRQPSILFVSPHRFSRAAMVASVSPSWTNILAINAISSTVRLQAMTFASAVTALVSSSDFLVFNVHRVPHQPLCDAPCHRDAEAARRANRASMDGCPC